MFPNFLILRFLRIPPLLCHIGWWNLVVNEVGLPEYYSLFESPAMESSPGTDLNQIRIFPSVNHNLLFELHESIEVLTYVEP